MKPWAVSGAVLLAAVAATTSAFRIPAAPSPRVAPLVKASALLQQQAGARSAAIQPWGVRGGAVKVSGAAASDDNSLKNWDPQQWIAPAFHNRNSVRLLAVLAAIGAVIHKTGTPVPRKVAAFVHLLSYGANLGAQLYTTFVLGIVMIKMLPRQMFGKLQSKLFPIYFGWSAVTLALQLLTGPTVGLAAPAMRCLGLSLAMTLLNILVLEPKSTSVMFKRYAMENNGEQSNPEYKKLAASFGALHGMSSLANLVALVGAFSNGYYLALTM